MLLAKRLALCRSHMSLFCDLEIILFFYIHFYFHNNLGGTK